MTSRISKRSSPSEDTMTTVTVEENMNNGVDPLQTVDDVSDEQKQSLPSPAEDNDKIAFICGACCPTCYGFTKGSIIFGNNDMEVGLASDVVMVVHDSTVCCNEFQVSFPTVKKNGDLVIRMDVDGTTVPLLEMCFKQGEKHAMFCQQCHDGNNRKPSEEACQQLWRILQEQQERKDVYSISFQLYDQNENHWIGFAQAHLFVWQSQDRVMIFDIDGTITKSNVRGVWDTIMTQTYQWLHNGVCQFLSSCCGSASLRVVYLTSRPLQCADVTRKFLSVATQSNSSQQQHKKKLPWGPIICQDKSIASVLMSELVWQNTYLYKASAIQQNVLSLFQNNNPLVAGFGNTPNDTVAYHMVKTPILYQIDKSSRIKMIKPPPQATNDDLPSGSFFRQHTIHTYQKGYQDPKLLEDFISNLSSLR